MDAHELLAEALEIASDRGQRSWIKNPVLVHRLNGAVLTHGTRTFTVSSDELGAITTLTIRTDDGEGERATFTTRLAEAYIPVIVAEYLR